jgi:hypothetical protein
VVIVPVVVTLPHPPVKVTVYVQVPTVFGDTPLIVNRPVFGPVLTQLLLMPAGVDGDQVTVAPVAQVVLYKMVVIGDTIHTAWLLVPAAEVSVIVLIGLTSTVAVIGLPGQPFADGVMVKVTVIGLPVVLLSIPLILPVPLAAMPVTVAVLLRVQL